MDYTLGVLLCPYIVYAIIVWTFIVITESDYYTVPEGLILKSIQNRDWIYYNLMKTPIGTIMPGDVLEYSVFNNTFKIIKLS